MNMRDFIRFCKKRDINITKSFLEDLEKKGLFYPIFRIKLNYENLEGFYPPGSYIVPFLEFSYNQNNVFLPQEKEFVPFSEYYNKEIDEYTVHSYYSSYQIYLLDNILNKEYSKQSLQEADLILFVYDSSQGLTSEDNEILELIKDKKYILISNKSDLKQDEKNDSIHLSALTGEGIETLKTELKQKVCEIEPDNLEFVTNTRQQNCLRRARNSIEQALLASQLRELQDLISIDVKSAILSLDELTGELITDEILNNIFDNFCIGK